MAATASLVVRLSAALLVVCCCCTASSAAPPLGKWYRVGGPEGWRVPPPEDKEMFYVKWVSPITFFVEDSIEGEEGARPGHAQTGGRPAPSRARGIHCQARPRRRPAKDPFRPAAEGSSHPELPR